MKISSTHRHMKTGKIAARFAKAELQLLRKQERVWEPIDTQICLSFPEFTMKINIWRYAIWRKISQLILDSKDVDSACDWWKAYAFTLKQKTLLGPGANATLYPRFPLSLDGEISSKLIARMAILFATRGLPTPGPSKVTSAILKFEEVLSTPEKPIDDSGAWRTLLRAAECSGMEIASLQFADHFKMKRTAHVSLSNSACFEMSRSDGGKRTYVLQSLKIWLDHLAQENKTVLLPTGQIYLEEEGKTRRETVRLNDADMTYPYGSIVTSFETGGNFAPFLAGLDPDTLGFQMFCWSFDTLKIEGVLDKDGCSNGRPPKAEISVVREPGNKARIVTKIEAALVVYGQPYAHVMKEFLALDPTLRSGLAAGYQAWEFYKRMRKHRSKWTAILAGDFETATDFLPHKRGQLIMEAFFKGMGTGSPYLREYTRLILSPFTLMGEEIGCFQSTRGCLMGAPGSKVVLTILVKTAFKAGTSPDRVMSYGELESLPFASAGDDVIAFGQTKYLNRYRKFAILAGLKPHPLKWGIYRRAASFCEQIIRIQGNWSEEPHKAENPAFIDNPKSRLFSLESRPGKGDIDTNPVYGKSRMLGRMLSWQPELFPGFKTRAVRLFVRNFRRHTVIGYQLFLPTQWGGMGIPCPGGTSRLEPYMPKWHIWAIHSREDKKIKDGVTAALARWSTNRSMSRGLITDADILIRDAVFPTISVTLSGFLKEVFPEVWTTTELFKVHSNEMDERGLSRYSDKVQFLRKEYITTNDIYVKVTKAQSFKSLYDLDEEYKTNRGFKTKSLAARTRELKAVLLPLWEARDGETYVLPNCWPGKLEDNWHLRVKDTFDDIVTRIPPEYRETLARIIGAHGRVSWDFTAPGPQCFLRMQNGVLLYGKTEAPE